MFQLGGEFGSHRGIGGIHIIDGALHGGLAPALGKHRTLIVAHAAVCAHGEGIIPHRQDIAEGGEHIALNQVAGRRRVQIPLLCLGKTVERALLRGDLHLAEITVDIRAVDGGLQGTFQGRIPTLFIQAAVDEIGHTEEGAASLHLAHHFLRQPGNIRRSEHAHLAPGGCARSRLRAECFGALHGAVRAHRIRAFIRGGKHEAGEGDIQRVFFRFHQAQASALRSDQLAGRQPLEHGFPGGHGGTVHIEPTIHHEVSSDDFPATETEKEIFKKCMEFTHIADYYDIVKSIVNLDPAGVMKATFSIFSDEAKNIKLPKGKTFFFTTSEFKDVFSVQTQAIKLLTNQNSFFWKEQNELSDKVAEYCKDGEYMKALLQAAGGETILVSKVATNIAFKTLEASIFKNVDKTILGDNDLIDTDLFNAIAEDITGTDWKDTAKDTFDNVGAKIGNFVTDTFNDIIENHTSQGIPVEHTTLSETAFPVKDILTYQSKFAS